MFEDSGVEGRSNNPEGHCKKPYVALGEVDIVLVPFFYGYTLPYVRRFSANTIGMLLSEQLRNFLCNIEMDKEAFELLGLRASDFLSYSESFR